MRRGRFGLSPLVYEVLCVVALFLLSALFWWALTDRIAGSLP